MPNFEIDPALLEKEQSFMRAAPVQLTGGAEAEQGVDMSLGETLTDVGKGVVNGVAGFGQSLADLGIMGARAGQTVYDWMNGPEDVERVEYTDADKWRIAGKTQTVWGGLAKGITQFGLGMVTGSKLLTAAGWGAKAATATAVTRGTIARSVVQGGIADLISFSGQEERFSNLINDYVPQLRNPLSDYLAADGDDSELEGRLKNTIEGIVMAPIAEILAHSVRMLKGGKAAKVASLAAGDGADAAEAAALKVLADAAPETDALVKKVDAMVSDWEIGGYDDIPPAPPPLKTPKVTGVGVDDVINTADAAPAAGVTAAPVAKEQFKGVSVSVKEASGFGEQLGKNMLAGKSVAEAMENVPFNFAKTDSPEQAIAVVQSIKEGIKRSGWRSPTDVRTLKRMTADTAARFGGDVEKLTDTMLEMAENSDDLPLTMIASNAYLHSATQEIYRRGLAAISKGNSYDAVAPLRESMESFVNYMDPFIQLKANVARATTAGNVPHGSLSGMFDEAVGAVGKNADDLAEGASAAAATTERYKALLKEAADSGDSAAITAVKEDSGSHKMLSAMQEALESPEEMDSFMRWVVATGGDMDQITKLMNTTGLERGINGLLELRINSLLSSPPWDGS